MTVVTSPGVHSDSFLPACFVPIGWRRRTNVGRRTTVVVRRPERLTRNDLNVNQMEMNRMCIGGQIQNLPNLNCVFVHNFGGRIHEHSPKPCTSVPEWNCSAENLYQPAKLVEGFIQVSNLTGVPAGMVGIPLGTTVARNGSFPAVKSVA